MSGETFQARAAQGTRSVRFVTSSSGKYRSGHNNPSAIVSMVDGSRVIGSSGRASRRIFGRRVASAAHKAAVVNRRSRKRVFTEANEGNEDGAKGVRSGLKPIPTGFV